MFGIKDIVEKIDGLTDRMGAYEKSLVNLSKSRSSDAPPVFAPQNKAYQAKIGFGTMGEEGSAEWMFSGSDPFRRKAIGMGSWLTDIAHAGEPAKFGADLNVVRKRLFEKGSRAVLKSGEVINKTVMAEGSGVLGGYTVPPQYVMELIRLVAEQSFTRQKVRSFPVTGKNLFIPVLDQTSNPPTGSSAYFGGAQLYWQPEGATYSQTNPNFRQVELNTRDLVALIKVTNQLLQDNAIALDSLLTTLMTDLMAWSIDYYVLNGDGAQQPLGCLNANNPGRYVQPRATSAQINFPDIINMYGRLLPGSMEKAVWLVHPSAIQQLLRLSTVTANPTTTPGFLTFLNAAPPTEGGPLTNRMAMQMLGIPMIVTEKVSHLGVTGDLCLVDLSHQLFGDRMSIQIEASQYPGFDTNTMTWRIIQRWDSQPEFNSTVKLQGLSGSSAYFEVSPTVVLSSATS